MALGEERWAQRGASWLVVQSYWYQLGASTPFTAGTANWTLGGAVQRREFFDWELILSWMVVILRR